ncbi:uncharacterized protein [Lolium perenne]|uniref:uncharacterized protein n=1 Tax=Lolium perenne TaxID=4522 RepID=UPI0021EAB2C7|nr:uncharacterized protein LOC127293644 [Lolium perenne]
MAAAAATSVRGCGPASASSVSFSPRRVTTSSFLPPLTRRASSSSARARALVADGPPRALQPVRREQREPGLLESVFGESDDEEAEEVGEERVEGWMRESIAEIVRHVGEAPFLVHLFRDNDRDGGGVTVQREPASAETWPDVRRRWGKGGAQRRPDGIILVEQVAAAAVEDGAEAARQVWGLVVQARGMECAACYVLDTCRVRSPAGFCTHFCLARAQCFGEPLELQLRNAWLNRLSGHRR